ncbi:MAG: hypothetical protein ACKVHU_00570 [Acidimicrobiales bacterium]|jgi:hypothetical protein
MATDPKSLMRTYIDEVIKNGRTELIDEIAHPMWLMDASVATACGSTPTLVSRWSSTRLTQTQLSTAA